MAISALPGHPSARPVALGREIRLAARFALVGWVGLAVDYALLRLGLSLGLTPPVARVLSLLAAMHVTFVINGLFVFRCLNRRTWLRQWAGYIATNSAGNLCNWGLFVGLVGSRAPVVSNHLVALCAGAATAWVINYAGARLVAFAEHRSPTAATLSRRVAAYCPPKDGG